MGEETENIAAMRQVYERWHESRGANLDCWIDMLDEKVSFESVGNGTAGLEFTVARKSRDEVRHYLDGLSRDWQMVYYRTDEYIAQGDRVVMLGRCSWRHRGTGKTMESPKVDIVRFKNGKIVDFIEFFDTAKAVSVTVSD